MNLAKRVRKIQTRLLAEIEARLERMEKARQPGAGHIVKGGERPDVGTDASSARGAIDQ